MRQANFAATVFACKNVTDWQKDFGGLLMPLKVYNTLTRKKEAFVPRQPRKVGMYVCGPTVYNYIHIGNARTFLNFDLIRRYLGWRGFEVNFIQNITDIDDKIINRAKEEGIAPEAVARKYLAAFQAHMNDLGIEPPTKAPKATEHIKEMIELIQKLVDRGVAYETEDGVYFAVEQFPGYGKLSRRSLEEMRAGERVKVDEKKKNPMDFALWKKAKAGEPFWDSPWGKGRPGWHIECSAMSLKYLGMGFDIHGGAQDLIFPHHENEIAQSEGALGKEPFVYYWLHAGLLNINEEKMSKSLGNFTLLADVLKDWQGDVIRMLMLGTHYRNPLEFSDSGLHEAQAKLERIIEAIENIDFALKSNLAIDYQKTALLSKASEVAVTKFVHSMDDDFNSAGALAAIFGLIKEVNSMIEGQSRIPAKQMLSEVKGTIIELCQVLGLNVTKSKAKKLTGEIPQPITDLANQFFDSEQVAQASIDQLIARLLDVRAMAREKQDFKVADNIRKVLVDSGVEIEDTPQGWRWRIKSKIN
jgi:cysteinyl-tRNA synthetase